jgi:ring-1,2-phenylacetyl-CoA epoxidase subunit PaaE
MTPKYHSLRIAEVRRETAECVSLRFEVPAELEDAFRFDPGQHVGLRATIGADELRRSYSICSAPGEAGLRVAIKRIPGGRFSTWANERLKPGDVIDVLTPSGRFHTEIDPAHAKHYVAFAAGSGITPVWSLAKSVLAAEPRSCVTLVYGNRRQVSVIFREALEDLKDRYLSRFALVNVFSREQQEIDLFNGRIDAAKVRTVLTGLAPADTIDESFVCGPATMIDEVQQALIDAGVDARHVHVERFGSATAAAQEPEPDAAESRVTLLIDGVRREVEFHRHHASILEAGQAVGLDLPYSCKGGMCCTCRAKLIEGQVKMHKNFALEPADVAAGFVLSCQAYPLTGRVVLSFDER